MKAVGQQVAAAAAAAAAVKEADKEKKRRRRQNRRTKQNPVALPGGGCSSVDSASPCGSSDQWTGIMGVGPISASEVAFSSLPIMHFNTDGDGQGSNSASPPAGVIGGKITKSCPLPASSYPVRDVPASGAVLPVRNVKKQFDPHWSEQDAQEAIKRGRAFKASFRVNAHNRLEAYCTIVGIPVDVLINGLAAQNRAIEGDVVAVMLDPVEFWTKLKGVSTRGNLLPLDGLNMPTEAREVIDNNGCKQEQVDTNYNSYSNCSDIIPLTSGCQNHENSGFVEAVISDLGNGSVTSDDLYDRCNSKALMNTARNCNLEQGEVAKAIERICTLITSNQSKRPTGRVLSIICNSPRREAVIGFLALKPWLPEGEKNVKRSTGQLSKKNKETVFSAGLDYIQLIPTDSKFSKMIVNVRSLPDCAKERLKNGDISIERELIAARIDEWNEDSLCPKAQVIRILGQGGEIEPQISAILFENAISSANFSPEALACLPDVPWKVSEEELKIRKDLRNACTFTIDPPSAIDLDDALSIEQVSDKIFRIGVHIADVSWFVLPELALDTEAQVRSTSVYILQHKLPMLPPKLSEDACSLLPGADKLAFSVIWDIDESGNIISRWIGRSVIYSCCKLSYDNLQDTIDTGFEVDRLIHSGKSFPEVHGNFELKDVVNSLKNLHEISKKLSEIRFKDGALRLNNRKLVILFDDDGIPCDSFLNERKHSCSPVEEFMLLANKSVAEVISRAFPDCALLRRHPEPNLRKLKEFKAYCSKHGFELDVSASSKIHLSLTKIREKLKNDPVLFDILTTYASKPMQPASYFCSGNLKGRENDWAHYALSIPYYTHFTSPLRRYPDIIVHRTLAAILEAEEIYVKQTQMGTINDGEISSDEVANGCFTGVVFDKNAAESEQGRKSLLSAALKHKVPVSEVLAEVADYCNDRKLAGKHAEDAGVKLYLWTLLKRREVLLSKARVMALGPRFMTIYVNNFAIERRIYYDDVEGLAIEWLETTATLILDLPKTKPFQKRGSLGKFRVIEDVALVLNTSEIDIPQEENKDSTPNTFNQSPAMHASEDDATVPMCFPLVLRNLSTIPVSLHAVGGHDGPIDFVARLYMSSYFK